MTHSSLRMVWGYMDTPVGTLTMACTHQGLCYVHFNQPDENPSLRLKVWLKRKFSMADAIQLEENSHELLPFMDQLDEYFRGERREFSLHYDLHGTPFQKKVWEELKQIPYGDVRTYKEIAKAIGAPKAVRAVGGANNKNPIPIFIPCHRVIGSNGSLVGYGGGLWIKKKLLHIEKKEAV